MLVLVSRAPLASPAETVMAYVENNDEITNMIARELTGIPSENSMKSVFLSLKKRGLLEPVPGKTTGGKAAWRKTSTKKVPRLAIKKRPKNIHNQSIIWQPVNCNSD